ncbi:LOW QUALITY PROTEIN: hypothetical protein PanWU01x14_267150, partial [Parasponia andersonii]
LSIIVRRNITLIFILIHLRKSPQAENSYIQKITMRKDIISTLQLNKISDQKKIIVILRQKFEAKTSLYGGVVILIQITNANTYIYMCVCVCVCVVVVLF